MLGRGSGWGVCLSFLPVPPLYGRGFIPSATVARPMSCDQWT